MEFNEKLQELRKKKGLTQEELAEKLFVSRTAVSKWESGRGYPNIDSLKAIAVFFAVPIDQLLSSEGIITIAENDCEKTEKHYKDLVFGLLDLCISLLFFLPVFADRFDGAIKASSLLTLADHPLYLKLAYFAAVVGLVLTGFLTLAFQNCTATVWLKSKTGISLTLGVSVVLLFTATRHPYAAVFAFALLAIKAIVLIKHR